MRIISIGEILWDLFGEAEHLGGAPFNFAVHSKRLGHDVLFVSAVGDDERGELALAKVLELGLSTRFIQSLPGRTTGTVTVELDAQDQPQFVIHTPAAYDFLELRKPDFEEIAKYDSDWIYFGTLHQMSDHGRQITELLVESSPRARRFYDINLRPEAYTPNRVRELLERADVVKLNEAEVDVVASFSGTTHNSIEDFCRKYSGQFKWEAVCVTRGALGCCLLMGNQYVEIPGYPIEVADAVGAGDAFAAAFLHGLSAGWPPTDIGDFANRVGALVASRKGAVPMWTMEECESLAV